MPEEIVVVPVKLLSPEIVNTPGPVFVKLPVPDTLPLNVAFAPLPTFHEMPLNPEMALLIVAVAPEPSVSVSTPVPPMPHTSSAARRPCFRRGDVGKVEAWSENSGWQAVSLWLPERRATSAR